MRSRRARSTSRSTSCSSRRRRRPRARGSRAPASKGTARRVPALEHELAVTKEYLHAIVEEHTHATDELGSANEELVSGNEELQSMNEELETAKEELQSTNEELVTVNEELRGRNHEVNEINADLVNLIATVDIPIVILDMERKIRRFSPRARELLNVVASDVGRPLDDIRPNVDVPDLDRQIADVISSMVPREWEVQDRSSRWHQMRIRPYRGPDGRTNGAILSFVDIDELKQNVRVAQEARADAERANRAKDHFLAMLSHELRTPLSTMLLQAQLLLRGTVGPERITRAGEAIERGTRVQMQLIDDLLDVSRIVSGKLLVTLVPIDLRAVIDAAVELAAPQAHEKSIEITVEIDDATRLVSGDAHRLQQVVSNLLTNAVKFTPQRGHVTIRLGPVGDAAVLRVTDTGMGIAADFLPHVFSRFTQEDATNARVHGGLGLGLAIVHYIVEAHGGTITAESEGPRKGATFSMSLPMLAAEARVAPATLSMRPLPLPASATALAGHRILLVDDDASAREAVVATLEGAGADVRAEPSAARAMIALAEFQPDALVSDVAMPGEGGHSLIRRVRALGRAAGGDLPALALTALASSDDRRAAIAAGFDVHLARPVDIDRLVGAVAALVNRKAPSLRSP